MKRITSLRTVAIAAVALTLAPALALGVHAASASQEWEYGIIEVDIPGFEVPCLNETLRIVAAWPFKRHEVWTPTGGYSYKFQFTPATPSRGGHYVLIGESTGKIYYSQNGMPANESFHLGPNEVFSYRSHERYVAEDGERLTIDWHLQFTTNANGDPTVELFLFDCRVR